MEEATPQVPAPVQEIVKKFPKSKLATLWPYIVGSILVVLGGVGVGQLLSTKGKVGGAKTVIVSAKPGANEAGVADPSAYKDTAEGLLEEGGIKGEGTYHLTRTGGKSQTVYLTSTSLDLSVFLGKKVQIWGQTLSAKYAGWLMDVGKIKVIE